MTLKEKFEDKIVSFLNYKMKEKNAIECVKIADEFAIEFAEWICKNYETDAIFSGILDTKELLKTFKKEKGL